MLCFGSKRVSGRLRSEQTWVRPTCHRQRLSVKPAGLVQSWFSTSWFSCPADASSWSGISGQQDNVYSFAYSSRVFPALYCSIRPWKRYSMQRNKITLNRTQKLGWDWGKKEREDKEEAGLGQRRNGEEAPWKQKVKVAQNCKTRREMREEENPLTLSKPMVSCSDGAEYRWSEGSMSWSTADKERRATVGQWLPVDFHVTADYKELTQKKNQKNRKNNGHDEGGHTEGGTVWRRRPQANRSKDMQSGKVSGVKRKKKQTREGK